MVAAQPGIFVATMAKADRPRRIFLDYLRNDRTSTSVAGYSPRAREGAPVSTPVSWDELAEVRNDRFTMPEVLQRLRAQRRDPWADYWNCRQALPSAAHA
jgi:bifunctional non-homologous end joining protein LigD